MSAGSRERCSVPARNLRRARTLASAGLARRDPQGSAGLCAATVEPASGSRRPMLASPRDNGHEPFAPHCRPPNPQQDHSGGPDCRDHRHRRGADCPAHRKRTRRGDSSQRECGTGPRCWQDRAVRGTRDHRIALTAAAGAADVKGYVRLAQAWPGPACRCREWVPSARQSASPRMARATPRRSRH